MMSNLSVVSSSHHQHVQEQIDLDDEQIVVLKLVNGESVISFAKKHDYAFELFSPLRFEFVDDEEDCFSPPNIYFDDYATGVEGNTYWVIRRHVINHFDEDQIDHRLVSAYLRRVEWMNQEATCH